MVNEIRDCNPTDQLGESYPELSFPVAGNNIYHLALSDEILRNNLPTTELAQICKSTGNQGYSLSPQALQILRNKLDPNKQGLVLPAQTESKLAESILWLLKNPPPALETDVPNTNRHIVTSMHLDSVEVAIFRQALGDSLDGKSSYLRRISSPFDGASAEGPARYAFSVKVDATQYDRVLFYLDQFVEGDDVRPETQVRVALLKNEVEELKTAHLRKRAPEKALIIPDSYFGAPENVASARQSIAQFERTPPQLLFSNIDEDDYTLFREPLFPSDIAFLRWKMGDHDNSLFVNYNGHVSTKPGQALAFYIKRKINRDQLIAALAVLESSCRTERMDDGLCNRVTSLVHEAERVDGKIKDEDIMYQARKILLEAGIPFGFGGAIAGAAVGVAGTLTVMLVKWIAGKMSRPRTPPSPPTPGGPSTVSELDLLYTQADSATPAPRNQPSVSHALNVLWGSLMGELMAKHPTQMMTVAEDFQTFRVLFLKERNSQFRFETSLYAYAFALNLGKRLAPQQIWRAAAFAGSSVSIVEKILGPEQYAELTQPQTQIQVGQKLEQVFAHAEQSLVKAQPSRAELFRQDIVLLRTLMRDGKIVAGKTAGQRLVSALLAMEKVATSGLRLAPSAAWAMAANPAQLKTLVDQTIARVATTGIPELVPQRPVSLPPKPGVKPVPNLGAGGKTVTGRFLGSLGQFIRGLPTGAVNVLLLGPDIVLHIQERVLYSPPAFYDSMTMPERFAWAAKESVIFVGDGLAATVRYPAEILPTDLRNKLLRTILGHPVMPFQ